MRFYKAEGFGNDFLIVPVTDATAVPDAGNLARALCDRRLGAGADGVVYISPSIHPGYDFDSRIYNADGSEAEVSGNGTRCAAAYLYYSNEWSDPGIRIATAAGVKSGTLIGQAGARFTVEFDMGQPGLSSSDLPMKLAQPVSPVVGVRLDIGSDILEVTCSSMGNPHCSIFVDEFVESELERIGSLVENHEAFPNRINVEFIRVISREAIDVRFWERGVGRTSSSGTGSCAAAVASILNGLTDRQVRVATPGGIQLVRWGQDGVHITGQASVLYEGRWITPTLDANPLGC